MSALDDLIKAAEDGARPWREPDDSNWPYARFALEAFDGSLDAALRLHEALLPGWKWGVGFGVETGFASVCPPGQSRNGSITVNGINPARAWLLAILRALKSQEGRE